MNGHACANLIADCLVGGLQKNIFFPKIFTDRAGKSVKQVINFELPYRQLGSNSGPPRVRVRDSNRFSTIATTEAFAFFEILNGFTHARLERDITAGDIV